MTDNREPERSTAPKTLSGWLKFLGGAWLLMLGAIAAVGIVMGVTLILGWAGFLD